MTGPFHEARVGGLGWTADMVAEGKALADKDWWRSRESWFDCCSSRIAGAFGYRNHRRCHHTGCWCTSVGDLASDIATLASDRL